MEIKAEVKSIQNLKDYFFVVPDYQREYVWEADRHVARFLQDIDDEYKPGATKQTNYFIGSTIIVGRDDGAFDVIDGQQRLTTIVIGLCAIRAVLNSVTSTDNNLQTFKEELLKVAKELLYKFDIQSRRHTPRLTLQYSESKDYLSKLIAETEFTDDKTPSISKMMEAYTTITDFLKGLQNSSDERMINFVGYFLANVEMVVIKPDGLSSALKIFETINERGVGLNAMDLLKNLLFSNANQAQFDGIKKTWKEMLNSLDECDEGDKALRFLRYFLMARYHDGVIREEEIYKWMISDKGKEKIRYQSDPVGFAEELKLAAVKYSTFVKATQARDADPKYPNITGIGYLSKKTSRQHLVLLMALRDHIGDSIINLLAKNIESLSFYYAVNRTLTKSYEERYAKWAVRLRAVTTEIELRSFLSDEFDTELVSEQAKFSSQFSTKSQNDLNPQYRVKYILGRIEDYIRQQVNFPTANFTYYQSQQLEHILPQTGENVPQTLYPQKYDYATTVYRFGNLTLLEAPINQSLAFSNDISSNQWFTVKRSAYLNSTILLTKTFSDIKIGANSVFNNFAAEHLKSFDEWNMNKVAERQEIIRKLIVEIWKLYS